MAQERRLWLNWEVFELATISPLFSGDISLSRISDVVSLYPDITVPLSFHSFKTRIAPTLKFTDTQTEAAYSTLSCFLTTDPIAALLASRHYQTQSPDIPCDSMRVSDMVVLLFAVFVKRQCRVIAERSNFEAFPRAHISLHSSRESRSAPIFARRPALKPSISDSGYFAVERFFITRFPHFLRIYAPDGLTRAHIESLGLLIQGGFSYALRTKSLIAAMRLFRNRIVIESIDGFSRTISSFLQATVKEDELLVRSEAPPASPIAYRPVVDPAGPNDAPVVINDGTFPDRYWVIEPPSFSDFYINGCQARKLYLVGAVPAIVLAYCKDTFLFVGATRVVKIESCVNCTVIVAARWAHVDSSIRCKVYLLVNTRPLVTGNCPDLVIAPYNALYRKFGLDLLSIGINPILNLWDRPVVLGSLGSVMPRKMQPSEFMLFVVPFAWSDLEPMISLIVPEEYHEQLEAKRTQVMEIKRNLCLVRERRPDLFGRIVEQLKERADRWLQERGDLQEVKWLQDLEMLE